MQADITNDCIFVQTDSTFNIAVAVLKSFKRDEIHVFSSKVVAIDNVESNDPEAEYFLRFGGQGANSFPRSLQCFARTASAVLRMMMLESVNAPPQYRPKFGKKL